MERLDKLVAAAEDSDDQWALARRAIANGHSVKKDGNVALSYELLRRGADALGRLAAGEATPEELGDMVVRAVHIENMPSEGDASVRLDESDRHSGRVTADDGDESAIIRHWTTF